MGQIHSDHRKVENSCNKYKHYKHKSAADVNEQHCIVSSSNKNVNKNLYYRSLPGNMSEQTNTVGAGTLNCNGNVFQKNSDDHSTVQILPNVKPTTSSTSSVNNSDSVSRDESSTQKIIPVRKITGANVEMSQIKNNSLPTGTIVKPQKSLHRFCNITSNLRRSNAKSLFTPKRHKSVKSTHEASSCFGNSDVSKGSFTKKKRSNWVTRFNCTKLKCTKSTDHHSLSSTIANVEKQSSANANCVCMCYRKTEENNPTSEIKLQPESSTTFNKIITKSNPQTNSIISVTVQNINHERTRRMCKPHENQSSSVDSINVTEYRPVRKSSIPALVSNSSESNLITMCKCSSSSACCSPTNVTGEASADKKKSYHSSVKTLHNSMVCHNDNRDVHNTTEVTESKVDPVFNVLPSRDSAQNQSSEISGSESLYGSFSDINNPQLVLDAPFDLVRLADCNSGIATINNHTSNCVQMLYSKGTGNDSHRCMQLVCHSDEITNRSNSTGHSNSHCSQGVSDDCLRTANGHYLLEPQPTSEMHHGQQSASSIEENIESSSQNSNDQSIPVHLNTSDSEQHVCSNKIIIPGQRRCLQLVCPTDISMESLKILFQSHFNSDTVLKCHTQVDYVHYLVPDLLQITSCSFYWGKMDRYEAERLLDGKPEGTFLLRDSAQEEFLFSVSFRKYGRSLHARIEQWNHKFSFDSHDPGVYSSTTVCGLIEHYKDPTCCMFFEPILTIPLHRNFTFTLQHLCRATIANKLKYDTIDLLQLPNVLKTYLKEYHYRQKVRVKRFDGGELQWVDYNTS